MINRLNKYKVSKIINIFQHIAYTLLLLKCFTVPRGALVVGCVRRNVVWSVEGVWQHTVPTDQPLFRGVAPPRPEPGQTQSKPLISHRLGAALLFGVVKGEPARVWQFHCTPLPAPSQPDLIKASARNLSQKAAN